MKKLITCITLALLGMTAAMAEIDLTKPATEINLGNFPIGTWYDNNWDGLWSFESNDIQLYKNEQLVYDFKDAIKDFTVKAGTSGLILSFTCEETHRSYQFIKPVSLDKNIKMIIDRTDMSRHYEKTLAYKK
jgi:hypothetical protein